MVYEFRFPDVGEGIHEGEIVKWHVKEGDSVKEDQTLAEIETDKAVVEIPSPKTGTIVKLYGKVGEKIKVGDVVSFRNFDSDYHTVTSGSLENGPNGEFDSVLMESGGQFLHEFTQSDEYDYFCMIHPWQIGKIIVHEK